MRSDPRRLRAWLAVGLWTGCVWLLSSDSFSAPTTSRFLGPLLQWLFPGSAPQLLEAIHFAIRKGAHLAEYAVLAALTFRALRIGTPRGALGSAALAFVFALSVAGADELRQSRSRLRTGAAGDVGWDAAGAASALTLLVLRARLRRSRSAPHAALAPRAAAEVE